LDTRHDEKDDAEYARKEPGAEIELKGVKKKDQRKDDQEKIEK
jgi:hypothetical protein